MNPRLWFICGAVLAALGVGNGAFAAHGLEDRLKKSYTDEAVLARRIEQYETGVRYQMYHSAGMLIVGLTAARRKSKMLDVAGFSFLAGIILFSGVLYLLVATNNTKLGMIVPIGGVAFVVGWLALAAGGKAALSAAVDVAA